MSQPRFDVIVTLLSRHVSTGWWMDICVSKHCHHLIRWYLFGAKPLYTPMLTNCWMGTKLIHRVDLCTELCVSTLGHQWSRVWFVFSAKPLSELMLPYCYFDPEEETSLRWRHNGLDSISNHQPHDCLLNRSFGRRSKKTTKLRVTGLCVGNSPVTGEFPAQMASDAENVSIWWRHHVYHFADAGSNATIYVQ